MPNILDHLNFFTRENNATTIARYSLSLMLVWFGAMNFTSVGEGNVQSWIASHAFLSTLEGQAVPFSKLLGALQIVAGAGLAIRRTTPVLTGAGIGGLLSFAALTLLFTNPVWLDSLGGFPAIGRGQGIIKYVTIFGVSFYLFSLARGNELNRDRALTIILLGLMLVLLWIGGMKFTEPEARGIAPLLSTSPFFSWMGHVFSQQGASNLIGVIEIIAAFGLLGWFLDENWARWAFFLGGGLCVITFLSTLSFLVTLPGWASDLGGFPALSGSGHFLLKDLVLLAGTILLFAHGPKGRGA